MAFSTVSKSKAGYPRRPAEDQPELIHGRKMRILALHGDASNSNILKFQVSQLQKAVGPGAEWIFMEGPVPYEHVQMDDGFGWNEQHNGQRSKMEIMLAKGMPFTQWGRWASPLVTSSADEALYQKSMDTFHDTCDKVIDFVVENCPIDVVIGCNMSAHTLAMVGNQIWRRTSDIEGMEFPWKLDVHFSPSHSPPANFGGPSYGWKLGMQKVIVVTSVEDPIHDQRMGNYRDQYYLNLTELRHSEGAAFPMKPPQAKQVYTRIAAEMWKAYAEPHPLNEQLEPPDGWQDIMARDPYEPFDADSAAASVPASSSTKAPARSFASISVAKFAELLGLDSCVVADIRVGAHRMRVFPGAQKPDISHLDEARFGDNTQNTRNLAPLKNAGKPVVVLWSEGGRDANEWCQFLVDQYAFEFTQLSILEGGVAQWEVWELENHLVGNSIRAAHGLPPLWQFLDVTALAPDELAAMLSSEACVVADAREPQEQRSHPFLNAARGVSFLQLRKKPHQSQRDLRRLREDGKKVVAVSMTGIRCRSYCNMLIKDFKFEPEQICWLSGGIQAWEAWAESNPDESSTILSALSLGSSKSSGSAALSREHSMNVLNA